MPVSSVSEIIMFFGYERKKTSIEAFIEGLKFCQLDDLIMKHPEEFKNVFTRKGPAIQMTADNFIGMYQRTYQSGRAGEDRIFGFFESYVKSAEGMKTNRKNF